MKEEYNDPTRITTIDPVTGLLSASGATNTLAEYAESWETHHDNFAVIRIFLPEYYRASISYGETIVKSILKELAKMIAGCLGVEGTCARLFAGNFVAMMKCEDKEKALHVATLIQDCLENVHALAGYPVTLHPEMHITFADEAENIHELIGLASGGSLIDIVERQRLEDQLSLYDLQLQTVIDAVPGGVMLHEILEDHTYRVIYASHGTGKIVGRSSENIKDELNADNANHMYEKDVEYVTKAVVKAVENNMPLDVSYRVYDVHHDLVWINMKGRIIGKQNGNPLLAVVYQKLSQSTKSYQEAMDESNVGLIVHSSRADDTFYQNRAAREFVDKYFEGSLYVLQKEIAKAMHHHKPKSLEEDGQYEVVLHGRTLLFRIISRTWNGREAKLIFIHDLTLKKSYDHASMRLLHNIPATILVFSQDKHGTYEMVYLSDPENLGVDISRRGGKDFDAIMSYVPVEDQHICYEAFEEAKKTLHPVLTEYRVYADDTECIWVSAAIRAVKEYDDSYLFCIVYADITERKRLELRHGEPV